MHARSMARRASGHYMPVKLGNLWLDVVTITLHDVLLVPAAPYNLLSQNMAQDRGIRVNARAKITRMLYNGRVVAVAQRDQRHSGLPVVKMWARQASIASKAMTARKLSEAELWHQRLGHLSYETVAKMVKHGAVKWLSVSEKTLRKKAAAVCDSCVMAKHAAKPHPESDSRARQALELVHSDLMGPFDVESAGGSKYILTAIDDFSGVAAVKLLKHKSEASAELKAICIRWEHETDLKLKKKTQMHTPSMTATLRKGNQSAHCHHGRVNRASDCGMHMR
jgi:hypothetical protein